MESLPELALCCLCRYLNDRDLASCTAVCKSWRRIFDSDFIWEGRINAALENHLRNNVSVVEPRFSYLDGPLQPPCQSRLASMREKHLWSNWEHGRTSEMVLWRQVGSSDQILAIKWGFMSDDFVYIAFDKTLEVWDVREDIATKVFESVHMLSSQEVESFAVIGDNREFAIASNGIRAKLFDVDNIVGSITEKYVLDLKTQESIAASRYTDNYKLNYATMGLLLFTIVTNISNSIAVWNLNTGQFVKEDPIEMSHGRYVVSMKGSKSSDAIAVVTAKTGRQSALDRAATVFDSPLAALLDAIKAMTNYIHVYCRRRQAFYDFVETVDGLDKCDTLNEFIAFAGENQILKVFNYRTCELIFEKSAAVYYHVELGHYELDDSYALMSVGGHFVYARIIFDPRSKTETASKILENDGFESMQSIDQLVALGKGGWVINNLDATFEFFEFKKGSGDVKLGLEIKGTKDIDVSPCCTKIIHLHGEAAEPSLRIQKLW